MYKVDYGYVSPKKILELDKLGFGSKKTRLDYNNFSGKPREKVKKLRNSGNFAVLEINNKFYYSHSSIGFKDCDEYISITGDKSEFIILKDNREFNTLTINGIERYHCTEAKIFEFLNDNIDINYDKEVTILSELDMCESCRKVYNEQFKLKYPNIKVNVVSGKEGVNWRKRK